MFPQLLLPLTLAFVASPAQAPSAGLGSVQFTTSCSSAVAADFNHAVALLHSFEYDEARDAFAGVLKKDPQCAMAKWGEAMTHFHGLWGEYNAKEGSRAVQEAQKIAASSSQTTARERAYINAIGEIFNDAAIAQTQRGDNVPDAQGYSTPGREAEVAYMKKMADLHKAFPDDVEATIFYALSLNIAAKRTDKQHPELHECTALLNPLFIKYPNHPGIAHYLVHCNDNPEMAQEGLPAARKYAEIAPSSAHATHMPSHIFAQLGLWDEMVASNKRSLSASEADVLASPCQKAGNSLHAMYFLTFALLQKGRLGEARAVVDEALRLPKESAGVEHCSEESPLVLAGFVMETGLWEQAKDIKVAPNPNAYLQVLMWFVRGVGAAKTGDIASAREAESKLDMRNSQDKPSHHGSSDSGPEVYRLGVAAWIAYTSGKKEDAFGLIKEAAEMQDRLGGTNAVFKSLRESYADMLLQEKRYQEALAQYSLVLVRQPNRFDALYGAGTAATATGDKRGREYYQALLRQADGGERQELVTARKSLGEQRAGQ